MSEDRRELERLLEKARNHTLTEEEIRAQRESWVRGEMGFGSDRDEAGASAAAPRTLTVCGDFFTRNACAQYMGQPCRWEISCTHTAGVRFTGAMVAHVEWRWRTLTMFTTAAGKLIIIEGVDGSTSTGWQTKAYMESSASRLAELVGRDHLLRELFDKAGIEDILEVP